VLPHRQDRRPAAVTERPGNAREAARFRGRPGRRRSVPGKSPPSNRPGKQVYDEDGTLIDRRSAFPLCYILTCSKLRRINAETQRARRNAEESLFFLPSLRPSANLCVSALRLF